MDHKLVTNSLGVATFALLFALTVRRGANDSVCGMRVDLGKALHLDFGEERFYFCSQRCLHAFELNPDDYLKQPRLTAPEAKGAALPARR